MFGANISAVPARAPGPLFLLVPSCRSTQPELHLGSAGLQMAKPWVPQCYTENRTLSPSPSLSTRLGLFKIKAHYLQENRVVYLFCAPPSSQPSEEWLAHHWLLINIYQMMNEWLNSPGSLHPSLLHSGWAPLPLRYRENHVLCSLRRLPPNPEWISGWFLMSK